MRRGRQSGERVGLCIGGSWPGAAQRHRRFASKGIAYEGSASSWIDSSRVSGRRCCNRYFAGLLIPARPAAAPTRSDALIAARTTAVTVPITPAGPQLSWVLAAFSQLPLSIQEVSAHFDAAFLAQVEPTKFNQALESLDPTEAAVNLLQLTVVATRIIIGRGIRDASGQRSWLLGPSGPVIGGATLME